MNASKDATSTKQPTGPVAPSPEAAAWRSSIDAVGLAAVLKRARRVVVLTHTRPDGDASGSALALTRALRQSGVDAGVWLVGPVPRFLPSVQRDTPVTIMDPVGAMSVVSRLPEPDAIVVVDTGAWVQVEEVRGWLEPRAARTCIIDHHLNGDAAMAPLRLIDSAAAAAAEIVADVATAVLGLRSAAELPADVAEAVYLGLATDTGWFKFSNARPRTMSLAADLMRAGVDHARLYEFVEQQDRPSRLRLLGRAMTGMELIDADRLAVMSLTEADFESTGADAEDAGGFAAEALSVATVKVAITLTEVAGRGAGSRNPLTKISLRSKPGPDAIDVSAIASRLGGGGHARAAGVKLSLPITQAKQRIVAEVMRP